MKGEEASELTLRARLWPLVYLRQTERMKRGGGGVVVRKIRHGGL